MIRSSRAAPWSNQLAKVSGTPQWRLGAPRCVWEATLYGGILLYHTIGTRSEGEGEGYDIRLAFDLPRQVRFMIYRRKRLMAICRQIKSSTFVAANEPC